MPPQRLAKRVSEVDPLPMIIGIVMGVVALNAIILASYCAIKRKRAREKRSLIIHPRTLEVSGKASTNSLSKSQDSYLPRDNSIERTRKPSRPTSTSYFQTLMTVREERERRNNLGPPPPHRGPPAKQPFRGQKSGARRPDSPHSMSTLSSNGRRLRKFSFPMPANESAGLQPPVSRSQPPSRAPSFADSASIYSSASAPLDAHERMFQSFGMENKTPTPSILQPHTPAIPMVVTALPPHLRLPGTHPSVLPWGRQVTKTREELSSDTWAVRWVKPQSHQSEENPKQGPPAPLDLSRLTVPPKRHSPSDTNVSQLEEEENNSPTTPTFAPSSLYGPLTPPNPALISFRPFPTPTITTSQTPTPTQASYAPISPLTIQKRVSAMITPQSPERGPGEPSFFSSPMSPSTATTTSSGGAASMGPSSLFYDRHPSNPKPRGAAYSPPGIPPRSARRPT